MLGGVSAHEILPPVPPLAVVSGAGAAPLQQRSAPLQNCTRPRGMLEPTPQLNDLVFAFLLCFVEGSATNDEGRWEGKRVFDGTGGMSGGIHGGHLGGRGVMAYCRLTQQHHEAPTKGIQWVQCKRCKQYTHRTSASGSGICSGMQIWRPTRRSGGLRSGRTVVEIVSVPRLCTPAPIIVYEALIQIGGAGVCVGAPAWLGGSKVCLPPSSNYGLGGWVCSPGPPTPFNVYLLGLWMGVFRWEINDDEVFGEGEKWFACGGGGGVVQAP